MTPRARTAGCRHPTVLFGVVRERPSHAGHSLSVLSTCLARESSAEARVLIPAPSADIHCTLSRNPSDAFRYLHAPGPDTQKQEIS